MKVALNTYSLRNEWNALTAGGNYLPIVKLIKKLEGVDEVELLDRSFKSDPNELGKIQKVFLDNGIKIFSLGPHPCPLVGKSYRTKALEELKKWTDIAADKNIHKFRLSLGGGKNYDKKFLGEIKPKNVSEAVDWTLEVLRPAVEYAEKREVILCIETHHKFSSNPEFQDKLLDSLPSKNLGFIYDIGNFETRALSWKSLDVLIKKKAIQYMHAKAYAFDVQGFETKCDYPKAIKLMHDAGFDINLSIEWEGRIPALLGVFKTYELCKYSIAKAEGREYFIKTQLPDPDILMKELVSGV